MVVVLFMFKKQITWACTLVMKVIYRSEILEKLPEPVANCLIFTLSVDKPIC